MVLNFLPRARAARLAAGKEFNIWDRVESAESNDICRVSDRSLLNHVHILFSTRYLRFAITTADIPKRLANLTRTQLVTTHLVPADIAERYEVHEWRNATGVLSTAHPAEWVDIVDALRAFEFKRSEVLKGGGRKSVIASRLDAFLESRGWREKKFATKIRVDETERDSPTHKVDCFKGKVGLEIEWNNKDPFFDRDLNNFRLLFDLRVIDAGVIVTRSSALQRIFKSLGKKVSDKYGASTTHMDKLLPRLEGGGGGGCPILAFGITVDKYVEDSAPIEPATDGSTDEDEIE